MRGEVAGSLCPFDGRFTIGLTIRPCCVLHHSVASFAGLHDGITSPTVVGTAALLHKDTFCSYLDGLTNHGDLPPFTMNFLNLMKMIEIYYFFNKYKKKSHQFW
jgi:hypothetical protein